jgi:RHS repeat-associated protein
LTNRITEAGYTFDPSGNLLCDPQHPCGTAPSLTSYFDYDAENRMVRAAGGAQAGGSEYVYDGDRRRIKKVSGSAVSVFVYNAAGMLVAEYGGAQSQTGGVSYLTQDMLGSTRAVTGQNGEVKSRHDYLPFGGEIDGLKIPNTGREQFTTYNYGSVTQKFTGKERDEETGLDYSVNRYYSSAQGRFTGVDPLLASAKVGNPQTWNRYSYVLNRPAIAVDPNGLATIVVIISPRDRGGDGSAVVQVFDRNGHEVTISGRDTNRIDGIGIGGSPNRSQKQSNRHRGGDTPFGVYKILPNYNGSNESGTQGGVAGSSARGQDERFGTGIITLEPVSGEVKAAKRSTIYLHGGPPIDQGSQELKSTNGCVRCHNDDINALIQTVNDLMKDGDTVTNVFIGDTPTLNAIGDERDWDQSSLYPQLRRAGFGTPTENDPTGTSPNTKPGDTRRRNQN